MPRNRSPAVVSFAPARARKPERWRGVLKISAARFSIFRPSPFNRPTISSLSIGLLAISKIIDWLIFTSVNGVAPFLERLRLLNKPVSCLARLKVAAIGPETAKSLAANGIQACLVPARYQAEGILETLSPESMRGKRVLIPRAAKAREVLPETLRQWGAIVDVVVAYRTVIAATDGEPLLRLIRDRRIDVITFTSSSTVSNFVGLFKNQKLAEIVAATPIACIGPITQKTVEELGGQAQIVAGEFTIPGLVQAIVDYFTALNAGK